MSKIIDLRSGGGELVVLGKAIVLPASTTNGTDAPLDGSIRFNPDSDGVEVFAQGAWAPLGGVGVVHHHTLAQIDELQAALDAKSPLVHMHPLSEITGLIAALAAKSAIGHSHVISDITDLSTRLATNSPAQFAFFIAGSPATGLGYNLYTAQRIVVPANFLGSIVHSRVAPTADYIIGVQKSGTSVGTLTLHPNGSTTFTTVSAAAVVLLAGNNLNFIMPTQDASLLDLSITVLGDR